MQYESAKFFSPNFSFHDGYEQFAKFFAHQIFPLYGMSFPIQYVLPDGRIATVKKKSSVAKL